MVQEMSAEYYPNLQKAELKTKTDRTNIHKRVGTKIGGNLDILSNQYTLMAGPQKALTQTDPLNQMHNR
jgi:hypothetical protein